MVIGGEAPEVGGPDNTSYAMDATSLGIAKGFIILGHVVSEEPVLGTLAEMRERGRDAPLPPPNNRCAAALIRPWTSRRCSLLSQCPQWRTLPYRVAGAGAVSPDSRKARALGRTDSHSADRLPLRTKAGRENGSG